jgi:hypothetical protein
LDDNNDLDDLEEGGRTTTTIRGRTHPRTVPTHPSNGVTSELRATWTTAKHDVRF